MKRNNLFSLNKTLRFSLIPIGKTEENFNMAQVLKSDEHRAEIYTRVKSYIDRYHRSFIEGSLSTLTLQGLDDYAALYYKKDESVAKDKEKLEDGFRNSISKHFKNSPKFNILFEKELIREELPCFLENETEIAEVDEFYYFTTYFTGFNENRKNIYKSDKQPTSIAYRCIHDNLPRYLDNAKNFEKVAAALSDELSVLSSDMSGLCEYSVKEMFIPENFNHVLTQNGINEYNNILGGYTNSDKKKVQGLNEYINSYNQKADKSKKLPMMKPLYRQILSNEETISYVPEKFENDNEVLLSINNYYIDIKDSLSELEEISNGLGDYEPKSIFVKNDASVTKLSQAVFGNWSAVVSAWEAEYDSVNEKTLKKNYENHCEKRKKAFKAVKAFSFAEIDFYGNQKTEEQCFIVPYFKSRINEQISTVKDNYEKAKALICNKYEASKRLSSNESAVELIKSLLDSIKKLELLVKPLLVGDIAKQKDEVFYGKITPIYDKLSEIDRLYDKVRNYVTQKPYSNDKIKLNFDNPHLLGGWDKNKESDYRCVLLKKGKNFYLAIMDKASSGAFENINESTQNDGYQKMEYKLLPGPNKMLPKVFFSKKNIGYFAPSREIERIYSTGSFKKGDSFKLEDCHKLIDFYKSSIQKHVDWSQFEFRFKETKDYADIGEFYNDVKKQGYKIRFKNISADEIENMVENGYIYLFQLYNKDFSENSKGTPNLHTLYFKMLFDESNLKNVVYKLNGEAEMFYRKPSIGKDEMIVHPANVPIKRKNLEHSDETSLFTYDLIKDKRYTKRQFMLHIPITMNFGAEEISFSELNYNVRLEIKEKKTM